MIQEVVQLLAGHPLLFGAVAAPFGLAIGSFLNVVVHRLPVMLERQWRRQCAELAGTTTPAETEPYTLVRPRSRCPHCGHAITALENIPVLSYLWLRGKCSNCGHAISWRYPAVELLTGLLSFAVAWQIGFGLAALAALLFTWMLVALAFIDLETQYLPDSLTLPLLWLGLLFNLQGGFVPLSQAVVGAVAGYLALWLVYHGFRLLTGKEGMGYGDFKLFAAFGAWLGWQQLPFIILAASLIGAVIGLALIWLRGHDRRVPIPFGPFLCAAGWVSIMWGPQITQAYLRFVRLA
jgi:leader peptidase (prepilin peptidase)/N-methyltransferase